jgi:hypothetical protein
VHAPASQIVFDDFVFDDFVFDQSEK